MQGALGGRPRGWCRVPWEGAQGGCRVPREGAPGGVQTAQGGCAGGVQAALGGRLGGGLEDVKSMLCALQRIASPRGDVVI